MTVTVNHAKTNAISDWTQAQLDEQIALGNFAPGTTLANIVLPSDWNDDHTLTGLGTMAEQNANSVTITGGSVNGTTIGATTASTGRFTSVTTPSVTATTTDLTLSAISTGVVNVNTLAGKAFSVTDHPFTGGGSNVNFTRAFGGQTGYSTGIMAQGTDGTVVLAQSSKGATSVQFFTSSFGAQQFNISHTASAVNYVQVTGAATGNRPTITAQGSDANAGLSLFAKGTGGVFIGSNLGTTAAIVSTPTTGTNYFAVNGSATTIAPTISIAGGDTNISMAFQPKGTGAIDLAAGSSGVNISNGGTVTAITVTNGGATAYTSHPTPAITAPTTAGGVQAVATSNLFYNSALASTTIVNGGTGYTVGNLLTVVGGTSTATAQFTVSAVSSGVVTAITGASGGTYSVIPTGTLSVTGGSGTGFTFTINGWGVRSLNIGTAGSGYIEQPTITFSGGGGSGAAAYATVGSNVSLKTLGTNLSFNMPGGEQVRIGDTYGGGSATNYLVLQGRASNSPVLSTAGVDTNIGMVTTSKGTGSLTFWTANFGSQQFQISHTASAVNYVQVTGAATANTPNLTAQGSDTNISMYLSSKGTGTVRFFTNGAGSEQFRVLHTAGTIVNYATATGSATGVAPAFSVAGSDTNIDLALTPKGTGVIQFGTHTANADTAISGYITIRDAGGTLRKLAVIT